MSVLDNSTAWGQPKQLLVRQRSCRHDHVWHQLQSLVNTVEGDCEQALLNVYLYEALHFVLTDNHNSVCFTFVCVTVLELNEYENLGSSKVVVQKEFRRIKGTGTCFT